MEIIKPESTDFTWEAGMYHVAITDAELKEGPKGKYAQFSFTAQEGDNTGKTLNYQNFSFAPKAVWSFIELYEAISDTTYAPGDKIPFDPDSPDAQADLDEFLNEELVIKVRKYEDTYEGEKKWKNAVQHCFSLSKYAQMRKDTDAYVASAPEREKMPF